MQQAFLYPWLLLTLLALPLLAVLTWRGRSARRRALRELVGPTMAARLAAGQPSRRRRLALTVGLVCLAIGMAGPRRGRDWSQSAAPGRDLVVVVDLSRSMFAGAPSRVELARLSLLDLAAALERRGGHRVALVAFAGKPELLCPLTHDLGHFRETIEAIDPRDGDGRLGSGTRLGAALAFAGGVFDGRSATARDVLLLSDGDDPARDGEFRRGIEALRGEGVPVHALATGDPDEPLRIPDGAGWLSHDGREVRTRLEEAPLREIARRTGGQLWHGGRRPFALGDAYLGLRPGGQDEDSPDSLPVLRQRQEWFLLPALLLLTLTLTLPGRKAAPAVPAVPGEEMTS